MAAPIDCDWYDYPHYYHLLFQDETKLEADFLEAAFARYSPLAVRRLLEPGCGSGRLVVELARRGYQVTGLDLNPACVRYVRRRLQRQRLRAAVLAQDMTSFSLRGPVDAAFCTFNTFRHLLSERAAMQHLCAVVTALRPGGLYVVGLHLLPLDVAEESIERWSAQRGETRVTATLRVLWMDRQRRLERLRLSLCVRSAARVLRLRSEFLLRVYTASQFRRLLAKVPELELLDVFDFWYDIERPMELDDEITDTILVLRRRPEDRELAPSNG